MTSVHPGDPNAGCTYNNPSTYQANPADPANPGNPDPAAGTASNPDQPAPVMMNPDQMPPPGYVAAGQMPAGYVAAGQMPAGYVATGQMQPGYVATGQMPAGQMQGYQMQPGQGFHMASMGNAVVMMPVAVTPQAVVSASREPVTVQCPFCQVTGVTTIEKLVTGRLIFLLIISFLAFFCCFVLLMWDGMKDVVHRCSNCKAEIGRYTGVTVSTGGGGHHHHRRARRRGRR